MSNDKKEDSFLPILIWMTKILVGLYAAVIIGGSLSAIFLNVHIDGSILASVTALMTTALGGLLAAVARKSRG